VRTRLSRSSGCSGWSVALAGMAWIGVMGGGGSARDTSSVGDSLACAAATVVAGAKIFIKLQ
jgi:hypothetical protein